MEEKLKSLISFAEATQKLKNLFLEELSETNELNDEIFTLLDEIINGEVTREEALNEFREELKLNLEDIKADSDDIDHSVHVKVDSFHQCTFSVPMYPDNTSVDIAYYLADFETPVIDLSQKDSNGFFRNLAVFEQKRGEFATINGLESQNTVLDLYICNDPMCDEWTEKYQFADIRKQDI